MSLVGDALSYVFEAREARTGGVEVGGANLLEPLGQHLLVSGAAMAVALAIALPLGLWLGHTGRGQLVAVGASNAGRAVPSLALIALFVAFFRFDPFVNVVAALAILAIPPVLANAYVGVRQVERDAVDAARGMGMTGAQIVRRVELPLAAPLVFGGIRTSAVNVVATATIAPLAGVVTLGDPIINGTIHGPAGQFGTALVVAALAVTTELTLAGVQRLSTPGPRRTTMKTRRLALAALLAGTAGLAACGEDYGDTPTAGTGAAAPAETARIERDAANASTTITVGSKNFTEQKLLGEIYAQALEAAGFTVTKELNLGDEQTALKALKNDTIDAYPEYTGTALLSFFDVPTEELPKEPEAAYQQVKESFAEDGIVALPPTPFTSSNEVAVTKETAERLGLSKISDLEGKAGELTLYGSPECRQRLDCLLGLQQVYGLEFEKFTPVDIALRHEVLEKGQADVSIVFTTDPQIQRNDEVLLEDDKGMFPPYNSTLLVREDVAEQAGPALTEVVELVNEGLTDEAMQELNARVDLDKQDPAEVAAAYLKETGLVS